MVIHAHLYLVKKISISGKSVPSEAIKSAKLHEN
jgi:hypothetical protein